MSKNPDNLYTFPRYLHDHRIHISIAFTGMILAAGLMLLARLDNSIFFLILFLIASLSALVITYDYTRRRGYYKELSHATHTIDHSWYFPSLVDEPHFLDGEISYTNTLAIARRASEEVEETSAKVRTYREYVEAWIHEVKTPITASRLVLERLHSSDADTLKKELAKIELFVEQALYFARSTNLNADYRITTISLDEVCKTACRNNAHFLVENKTTPHFDIPHDTQVLADASWLSFVITQIITNSAKYGARTLRFESSLHHAHSANECTQLAISDDGYGISPSDLPKITERGYVGENGRKEGSATGMGLYLAHTLSTRMGLGFHIASRLGEGTRVTLTFPHDRRRMEAHDNLTKE